MTEKQKAEAYNKALEKAQSALKDGTINSITIAYLQDIFPELKESEDEKIRKALLEMMYYTPNVECEKIYNIDKEKCIAWLEKQGEQEQLYIRFGEIPTDEKSKIYQGEIEVGTENGVSVYPAFRTDKGDIVLGLNLPITKTTLHTQQHLLEYDDRPCYLVKGNYVGKDSDGQPLINNVHIIRKIDSYIVKEENIDDVNNWDTENKILKKIENEIEIPFGAKDSELQEATYYIPKGFYAETDNDKIVIKKGEKPAKWSKNDERICKCLIRDQEKALDDVRNDKYGHSEIISDLKEMYRERINWLKSLKRI